MRQRGPGAHVLRLFLTPDHLGPLVRRHDLGQSGLGVRVEHLEPHEGDIVDLPRTAGLEQLVVELALAEHHAADFAQLVDLPQNRLEPARGEVLEGALRQCVPKPSSSQIVKGPLPELVPLN